MELRKDMCNWAGDASHFLNGLVGGDCKDIEGFFHYRCAQKRKTVPLLANVSSFPSQNAIFLISPFYLL
ncbi:hypothetical protein MANES_15G174300v8 [Manihot esculenta]|uniref:Uncharacterized protein n=1 Tax=Manihot esculenta TaxID=3983 RepID=A0A2C9UGU3_MANES|nr:hypothetical protein MANES_15G174300v8 [Manihot esculenta]